MEIKTLEEYVVTRIGDLENEVEALKEKLAEETATANQYKGLSIRYKDILKSVGNLIEIGNREIFRDVVYEINVVHPREVGYDVLKWIYEEFHEEEERGEHSEE